MSQSRRRGWGGDSRVCTSVCCHVCRTRHEALFPISRTDTTSSVCVQQRKRRAPRRRGTLMFSSPTHSLTAKRAPYNKSNRWRREKQEACSLVFQYFDLYGQRSELYTCIYTDRFIEEEKGGGGGGGRRKKVINC